MISIVVPTFNESQNIATLVQRTGQALARTGEDFELIIVDDESTDGTPEEVRRLQAEHPWLRLVERRNERDLSTAVIAGWRVARGDVLGCMDADLQHPPERLVDLVQRLRTTGADLVAASRHVKGGGVSKWSWWRRFISWTATLMAAFILPGTLGAVRDPMSGFFLMRRKVIDRVALNPVGYKILLEVLAKGDYDRVDEVPYVFEERRKGGTKLGLKTVWHYLVHLLCISLETGEARRLFSYALVGLVGALLCFLTTLVLLQSAPGCPVAGAAALGVAVAMVNNFFWNDRITFWETSKQQPGMVPGLKRFAAFVVFSGTGALLNVSISWSLAGALKLPLRFSLLVAIAVAGAFNFFINSNLTWRAWWHRRWLSRSAGLHEESTLVHENAAAGLELVPCNLCGSKAAKLLYRGNPQAAPAGADVFRCTSAEHGDFTNIVECAECGLLFENPREREAAIESFYAEVQDPTYLRETPGRTRTFSRLMDRLETFAGRPGRLLDVGCYTGVFLDVARARQWETCGVEPSAWAAGIARASGHEVKHSALRAAAFGQAEFDAITLWDVIEHLHDPLGTLRQIRLALKRQGTLALSTMNASALFAKVAGRRWPWFMRMHLYYFSIGTISRTLDRAGFRVLAIERHKRVVSLRYLVEKAAAALGPLSGLGRFLGWPLGRVFVTVDLGDIMDVFATPKTLQDDANSARDGRPGGSNPLRYRRA